MQDEDAPFRFRVFMVLVISSSGSGASMKVGIPLAS
jgi:hypothetical protein